MTTIGGGAIAEPAPPKRNRLAVDQRGQLETVLDGSPEDRIAAVLGLAGWTGVSASRLPLLTGAVPSACADALKVVIHCGALRAGTRVVSREIRGEAEKRILESVNAGHREDSLRVAVPLARVRAGFPEWAPSELADAIIDALCDSGVLDLADGGVRRAGFQPVLTLDQKTASGRLYRELSKDGLAAPMVDDLPGELTGRPDFWPLMRHLEATDRVRLIADGLYVATEEISSAVVRIRDALAGREGLGPAEFRDVLPVSRKHLIPLLNYFDGAGVTLRQTEGRSVPGP